MARIISRMESELDQMLQKSFWKRLEGELFWAAEIGRAEAWQH